MAAAIVDVSPEFLKKCTEKEFLEFDFTKHKDGVTALMKACCHEAHAKELVSHLFTHNPNAEYINARDKIDGSSALLYACRDADEQVVSLFLDNALVDKTVTDKLGYQPLSWACYKNMKHGASLFFGTNNFDEPPTGYKKKWDFRLCK